MKYVGKEDFSKEEVVEACELGLRNADNHTDKDILGEIIDNFSNNDFGLLTIQEINFLKYKRKEEWAQYLIYRWKFKNYPKKKMVLKFPLYLLIEPTSICNLKCTMCFQRDETFSDNRNYMGKMDLKLFKNIIDQAHKGGARAITLASRGEPTIHSQFPEMLDYCNGKFYEIKMNTNALLLNEKLIHRILSSDVNIIVFSIDAYDSRMYEKIRNVKKFEKVVGNIALFHKIRKESYPESKVVTRAHGVRVYKEVDPDKFYLFWKGKVDEVTIIECVPRWNTYNNEIIDRIFPCLMPFERMYIWYDGTCNPCDVDYKSFLEMGNVNDQTIEEIWNSKKFNQFRNDHIGGLRII